MPTLTLRPTSDISLSGNNAYSSGTSAYPLINEVTADDATTYVMTSTTGQMFIVSCASPDISKIKTINSLTVYIRCMSGYGANVNFGISSPSSGSSTIGIGTAYSSSSYTLNVNKSPSNFDLTNIKIYANPTSITASGDGKTTAYFYVTQMYVVINYTEKTITAYVKIGGAWKLASAVYVKIDGTWRTVASIYDKISNTWHTG